jgi:hypothetical protein
MGYPHVVVFVPGIAGSRLATPGGPIWTGNPATLTRSAAGAGRLALSGDGRAVEAGVSADAVLLGAGVLPGLAGVDLYGRCLRELTSALGLEAGRNLITFPYDWRLDNRVNAGQLTKQAPGWLDDWRAAGGPDNARLVFVAHSMGGLVARHAIEVQGLRELTAGLVTIGTPHRGAPKALRALTGGLPVLRLFPGLLEQLRRMPSVHQLLPVFPFLARPDRYARLTDPEVVHGLDAELVRDGAAFLREIETAARAKAGDAGPFTHAIVGVDQDTARVLHLPGGGGPATLAVTAAGVRDPRGDGTVPEGSAYPIEWDGARSATWVAGRHLSLPGMRVVLDQLTGWLSAIAEPRRLAAFRDVHRAGFPLSLDAPEAVPADTPLEFTVTAPRAGLWSIEVLVEAVDGPVEAQFVDPPGGVVTMPGGLPAGLHRIRVRTAHAPDQELSDLLPAVPAET